MIRRLLVVLLLSSSLVLAYPTPTPPPDELEVAPTLANGLLQHGDSSQHREPVRLHTRDYVYLEEEFEAVLERLRKEQEEKPAMNPENYLADEVSIEEIMRLIGHSSPSSPSPTTTTTTTDLGISATTTETTETTTLLEVTTTNERDLECPICLSSMQNTEVELLGCNHEFHADCLRDWIEHDRKLARCPICRGEVDSRRQMSAADDALFGCTVAGTTLMSNQANQGASNNTITDQECMICLYSKRDSVVAIMGCNHEFHWTCLLEWFKRAPQPFTCPYCRQHTHFSSIRQQRFRS